MDLNEALPGISWRRFCVLVSGLGPWSLWQQLLAADKDAPVEITDPDQAERYFNSI